MKKSQSLNFSQAEKVIVRRFITVSKEEQLELQRKKSSLENKNQLAINEVQKEIVSITQKKNRFDHHCEQLNKNFIKTLPLQNQKPQLYIEFFHLIFKY